MSKRIATITLALVSVFALILTGTTSAAIKYRVTNLGPGSASAINNDGLVTGYIMGSDNCKHVFLYDGQMHDLGPSNRNTSGTSINASGDIAGGSELNPFVYDGQFRDVGFGWQTTGINSSGIVVGVSLFPPPGSDGTRGVIYKDGALSNLPTLGGSYSACLAINNAGQIAGKASAADGSPHAIVYDGDLHDLGTLPGFPTSVATAINDAGLVTGYVDDSGFNRHVFLYDGTMRDLGGLAGTQSSTSTAINSSGVIVGSSLTLPQEPRAFIYTSTMQDLNNLIDPTSGWVLIDAVGINDSGMIVGNGRNATGYAAFILTPIPAPTVQISAPSAAATKSGPVTYTVTYTDAAAITLTAAKVTLTKTGTASGTVSVTGDGILSRTVKISSISGTGTLAISIAAGTASNATGLAPAAGPSTAVGVFSSAPKATIGAPSVTATKSGPVTFTITYANAATIALTPAKVTLSKSGTANGTVSVTGDGLTTRTVTISGITGDGTLAISLLAATATNPAGSAGAVGASAKVTVVNTKPKIELSSPSTKATKTGPITYTATYTGATAVTLSAADVTVNSTGTAKGSVSITGTGLTKRTITISGITGDGTIGISLAAGTASNVGGSAEGAGPSATFSVANTVPQITISAPSATTAKTGPVTYTITYDGATSVSISSSKIVLNKTGTAKGTVTVTGDGLTTRTVTISAITGDGTIGISVAAGTAKNLAGSANAAGPSATFRVTNSKPTATISAPSASATSKGPVSYTISYAGAESVALTGANVTLNRTGTANGTVSVTGDGLTTRTVTISAITGDGTLGMSVAAGTASNFAGATEAAGPSATFSVVNNPPGIIVGAPSSGSTRTGPVTFTITYTGAAAITLSNTNVTLLKTGTANGALAVTGTGTSTRTVTISGITGEGTLAVSIAAGTATNVAGSASAAGPSSAVTVTNSAPRITLSGPSSLQANSNNGESVSYTITYAGAGTVTLSAANVTLNKTSTASGTVTVTGDGLTSRVVTISSITGSGTLGISIAAGSASNAIGPAPAAGPSTTFIVSDPWEPPPPPPGF